MSASNLFLKISEIIKSDFRNSFIGGEIILKDSTSKPVKINKTGGFLCIQPDKKIKDWKNNFPFFETSVNYLCSVADHIIFYPKQDTLFVFLIELKSNNPTDAMKQILANYELGKYICGTVFRLLSYPESKIEYRGIIFSNRAFYKGNTKRKNNLYIEHNQSKLKFQHFKTDSTYDLDVLCCD